MREKMFYYNPETEKTTCFKCLANAYNTLVDEIRDDDSFTLGIETFIPQKLGPCDFCTKPIC